MDVPQRLVVGLAGSLVEYVLSQRRRNLLTGGQVEMPATVMSGNRGIVRAKRLPKPYASDELQVMSPLQHVGHRWPGLVLVGRGYVGIASATGGQSAQRTNVIRPLAGPRQRVV